MSTPTPDQDATIVVSELSAHSATVEWSGDIGLGGAAKFTKIIDNLFGYYMYQKINVIIESPGGQISALDYMLRAVDRWKQRGRNIAVSSNFECASAAALFLAFGQWGERKVDKHTSVTFHSARLDPRTFSEMTALSSSYVARKMVETDANVIANLVLALIKGAGSRQSLARLMLKRAQYIDENWKNLCFKMSSLSYSSSDQKKPAWINEIIELVSTNKDSKKFYIGFCQFLSKRFQLDTRMELFEAYALGLIDEINEVVSDRPLNFEKPIVFIEKEKEVMPNIPRPVSRRKLDSFRESNRPA